MVKITQACNSAEFWLLNISALLIHLVKLSLNFLSKILSQNQWLKTNLTEMYNFVNCQVLLHIIKRLFFIINYIKHYYYGNLLNYSWKVTEAKVGIWLYLVAWTEVRRRVLPSGCICLLEVQDQGIQFQWFVFLNESSLVREYTGYHLSLFSNYFVHGRPFF